MRRAMTLLLEMGLLLSAAGLAHGAAFSVGATTNIFLSGLDDPLGTGLEPGGGVVPVWYSVVGGSVIGFEDVVISSDPAMMACNVAKLSQVLYQITSADGGPCGTATSTNITGTDTVSGIVAPNTLFLVGVFMDNDGPILPPGGAAPMTLDFAAMGTDFASVSPEVNQVFFVGDGLTGTGSGLQQAFTVPTGATRLFLGFADANNGIAFQGPNSHYGDNFGSISGSFNTLGAVPEPATMAMLGLGLCAMGFLRRRRK